MRFGDKYVTYRRGFLMFAGDGAAVLPRVTQAQQESGQPSDFGATHISRSFRLETVG
jgi:hypothetical protein